MPKNRKTQRADRLAQLVLERIHPWVEDFGGGRDNPAPGKITCEVEMSAPIRQTVYRDHPKLRGKFRITVEAI